MSRLVVRCNDCPDENGRAKIVRVSCEDCYADWITKHTAEFPHHRVETSRWDTEPDVGVDRRVQRLTQRKAIGW